MPHRNLSKVAMSLIVILLVAVVATGITFSFFWDQQDTKGSFSTGSFGETIALLPGKSKANRHTRKPPSQLIAQTNDEGQIEILDFGEIPQGNSNNSTDIMRIKSIGSTTLTIKVSFSPEIKGLFTNVNLKERVDGKDWFGNPLEIVPGAEVAVGAKLLIPTETPPADYRGDLTISGAFQKKIPVLITVYEQSHGG